jgi:hypothetical protein
MAPVFRAFLVFLLSFPVLAEIPASVPPVEAAAFNQDQGRIASNGDGFLVVYANGGMLHGVRVSAERKVIDASPIVIAADGYAVDPDVAWGRDRYFVVWMTDEGVHRRMVSPDGSMSEPFLIEAGDWVDGPQVAFNGEVFLVVWTLPGPRETRGAIVGLDGTVRKRLPLGQGGVSFSTTQIVAVNGTFHVAAWRWQTLDVGLTTVASDGTTGAQVAVPGTDNVADFALGVHRDELVVAWNTEYPRVSSPIKGFIGDEPFELGVGWVRAIVSDDDGAFLVYGIDNEYARRIGSNEEYPLPQGYPSLVLDGASNGEDVALVTSIYREEGDLVLQTVGRAEVELLTRAPRHQHLPEIAALGDASLVVWSEPKALRMARIGPEGAGAPVDLETAISPHVPRAVASNGSEWLVIWGSSAGLVGARVSARGEVLERMVIARDVFFGGFDVAWDGSTYVVVFLRGLIARGGYITTVYATRVGSGSEVKVSETGDFILPAIAAGPAGAVVAWSHGRSPSPVHAVFLTPAGSVMKLTTIEDAASDTPPAVAWNGQSFLLAARSGNVIRWVSISANGAVVTPAFAPAGIPVRPGRALLDLAPFGSQFLLVTQGHAAIIDPRGFAGELVRVAPDVDVKISGTILTYARPIDAAWPLITNVFVKRLTFEPGPPRRRSVR